MLVPFDVPAGTTAVRVKYCFDQPEAPTPERPPHARPRPLRAAARRRPAARRARVPRLGRLQPPRRDASRPRASRPRRSTSPSPKGHVPGKTTRGFRPGPIPAGRWSAELGLAAIAGRALGDADGRVAWRVEVELLERPGVRRPSRTARPAIARSPSARRPAGTRATCTCTPSTPRSATRRCARPSATRSARRKLDFITLTDYVTDSAWGEIGRYKSGRPPGRALVGGHHLPRPHQQPGLRPLRRLPHRPGLRPRGRRRRDAAPAPRQPASRILRDVRRAGGFTQINHPTIFPSSNPLFALLCRGCPWDYSAQETNYELVDAIEVNTGPPEDRRGAEPVHGDRDRLLRDGARRRRARRGARRQRLAQRGPHRPARPSRPSASARPPSTRRSSPSAGSSAPSRPATRTRRSAASPARRCASRAGCRAYASRRSSATPLAGAA